MDSQRRGLSDEPTGYLRSLGAEELHEALSSAAAAGTTMSRHSRLLEMIVDTAARVIGARAASLFLVDRQAQELVFEVALGQKAEEVKKFRVPLGHGIAGLVAVTGQPMAISNPSSDPRHAHEIARAVGYLPQNILCVPLFFEDQVTGVLELLDKEGASSFSTRDMEVLGLFANLAGYSLGVAIEQSLTEGNLRALIAGSVAASDQEKQSVKGDLADLVAATPDSAACCREPSRYLELVGLVQEICGQGDAEFEFCRSILTGLAEYLRPNLMRNA